MISIVVNGQSRQLAPARSLADLVAELDVAGKRIAVEMNGDIVPKSRYRQTTLEDGDNLEIVIAVGGG